MLSRQEEGIEQTGNISKVTISNNLVTRKAELVQTGLLNLKKQYLEWTACSLPCMLAK